MEKYRELLDLGYQMTAEDYADNHLCIVFKKPEAIDGERYEVFITIEDAGVSKYIPSEDPDDIYVEDVDLLHVVPLTAQEIWACGAIMKRCDWETKDFPVQERGFVMRIADERTRSIFKEIDRRAEENDIISPNTLRFAYEWGYVSPGYWDGDRYIDEDWISLEDLQTVADIFCDVDVSTY